MKSHGFITSEAELIPADPWAAVESECPAKLGRAEHAGRIHVACGAVISCVAWRPLLVGERASDAWIDAARHRVRVAAGVEVVRVFGQPVEVSRFAWALEVPGAHEAVYPPPATMAFQMPDAIDLDRKAESLARELGDYYARVLRPVRRRRTMEFA